MKNSNFKIGRQEKNHKKRTIVIVLLFVALVAVAGFFILRQYNQQQQSEQKARDEAQTNNAKDAVENSAKNSNNTSNGLPQNSATTTTDKVPTNDNYAVVITGFSQANRTVDASAIVDNLTDSTTCVFTYTSPDSKPVVRQLISEKTATGQSCKVSVPEVEFARIGTWNLNVLYYINSTKVEANKSVTVQ